jgi:probable rRNA maturation factor
MYQIVMQCLAPSDTMPAATHLKRWAKAALANKLPAAEMTLRIVEPAEIIELNSRYRHKDYATNVLSFPFDATEQTGTNLPLLGDIVICADVVNREAEEQHKTRAAHWAHMVVHGTLHLLGYDHETEAEANIMEQEEIIILQQLGFANPYEVKEKGK